MASFVVFDGFLPFFPEGQIYTGTEGHTIDRNITIRRYSVLGVQERKETGEGVVEGRK